MFGPKFKLPKSLCERLDTAAEKAGYASTQEFVIHVLEREVTDLDAPASDEEVEKQLRGLGYIE